MCCFNLLKIYVILGDGSWSSWRASGKCNVTCGGGFQTRSRSCTNSPPKNGGRNCSGPSTDIQPCNTHSCPSK